jgi:ferritin-like protein
MDDLTLERVDEDGAIQEALAGVDGHSRADFLRTTTVGGAALLAALALPGTAASTTRNDTGILNYALTFEYLQSSFYTEADRLGTVAKMRPAAERWARVLGAHERAHVRILKNVLGHAAAKPPAFNFHGVTEDQDAFIKTAVAMEDLTVALLAGQTPRVDSASLRAAFFSLLTVEARHAAWARRIVGYVPVAEAVDEPKTLAAVDRVVRSTHFIVSRPKLTARRKARFTG